MKRFLVVLAVLLALAVGFGGALVVVALWSSDGVTLGERVGVVTVRGFIADAGPATRALRDLAQDDDVKAVLLRVETPGGGIAPSQEIHDEVARVAASKPVVVSMGAVAASGGYYLSAPATRIMANPGTATGSIGVILQYQEVHLLFDKLGLRPQVIKSGPLKDAGSPFRKMTDKDRAVFQGLIDDLFDQFVAAVAEGRNLEPAKVRELADGRVYSGRQALDLGLVDELGGFWDAVAVAGRLGGISGQPELEYKRARKRSPLRWLLGDDADALAPLEAMSMPPIQYALPGW